ncbi:hypothetical protein H5410_030269 [Solanum commersonii]|uniref:Uncharacterized protein n=1 Tax=Solanum commersonii TaxID=4109 RepID=A0A9J5YDU5_SOLCO|nr:hypothetical protein H5410_030269 [Solanum commersonii]
MAFKKINDVSCKDSIVATFIDFSDADGKKEKVLNGTCNYNPWGNIASMLSDELSQPSLNFGEFKNSTDSSISTKVNTLMVDATDMDEKFAMMEQTIETLKKFINYKNLQIAQLMSNLDLSNSGGSRHNLTIQEKIDHATAKLDHKKDLISEVLPHMESPKIEEGVIILQFGSFEAIEVFALKKTTNTSKVYDFSIEKNGDTLISIACKRKKHQGTSKL